MTQQQILQEIEQLPLSKRLEIIELVAHSARQSNGNPNPAEKPRRGVPVVQVRGIAKPPLAPPPNDEEADQIRYEYLMEKYG